jgi:hypothetical protein
MKNIYHKYILYICDTTPHVNHDNSVKLEAHFIWPQKLLMKVRKQPQIGME